MAFPVRLVCCVFHSPFFCLVFINKWKCGPVLHRALKIDAWVFKIHKQQSAAQLSCGSQLNFSLLLQGISTEWSITWSAHLTAARTTPLWKLLKEKCSGVNGGLLDWWIGISFCFLLSQARFSGPLLLPEFSFAVGPKKKKTHYPVCAFCPEPRICAGHSCFCEGYSY